MVKQIELNCGLDEIYNDEKFINWKDILTTVKEELEENKEDWDIDNTKLCIKVILSDM